MAKHSLFLIGLLLGPLCLACRPTEPPVATAVPAPASEPTSPTYAAGADLRIAALISLLGHNRFALREMASRELADIGLPATPALRDASASNDPEVALRAKRLLETIRNAAASNECLLWKTELPEGKHGGVALSDGLAFFHGGDNKIHALSRADGTPAWERPYVFTCEQLAVMGDKLIHVGGGQLIAMEAATGKEIWQTSGTKLWRDTSHLGRVGITENALVIAQDKQMVGLSPEDGTVTWTTKATEFFDAPHARLVRLQMTKEACLVDVLITNSRWILAAMEPVTGKRLWEIIDTSGWHSYMRTGAVDDKRVCVTLRDFSTQDVTIYGLKDGREREHKLQIDNSMPHNTIVKIAGDHLLQEMYGELTAYDLADGQQAWRYTPPIGRYRKQDPSRAMLGYTSGEGNLSPVVVDNAVLLAVHDGLLAMDLDTGQPKWHYPMGNVVISRLTVRDGIAYILAVADNNTKPRLLINGLEMEEFAERNGGLAMGGQLSQKFDDATVVSKTARGYLYAVDLAKARQLGPPAEETVDPTLRQEEEERRLHLDLERIEMDETTDE